MIKVEDNRMDLNKSTYYDNMRSKADKGALECENGDNEDGNRNNDEDGEDENPENAQRRSFLEPSGSSRLGPNQAMGRRFSATLVR